MEFSVTYLDYCLGFDGIRSITSSTGVLYTVSLQVVSVPLTSGGDPQVDVAMNGSHLTHEFTDLDPPQYIIFCNPFSRYSIVSAQYVAALGSRASIF